MSDDLNATAGAESAGMSSGDVSYRSSGGTAGAILAAPVGAVTGGVIALHQSNLGGRALALIVTAFWLGFCVDLYLRSGVSLKGHELVARRLFVTHRWRLEEIRAIRTELGPSPYRPVSRHLVVVGDRAARLAFVNERRSVEPSELARFVDLVRQRAESS